MAEFAEVMRQFDRMCKAHAGCIDCPLHSLYGVSDECSVGTFINKPDYIEREVMEWAAVNPEPVYPTWYRWLIMMGVVGSVEDLFSDLQRPIPADIAKKLGIDPNK